MNDIIKGILSVIVGLLAFLFGKADGILWALIALIVLDYITGIIAAIATKTLSSTIGAKGIAKKIFMLVIVMVGNIVDVNVIGDGNYIRNIAILFYIANECISIIENAGRLGVKVPKKLIDVLAQLNTKE